MPVRARLVRTVAITTVALGLSAALAGCALGPRPTFAAADPTVGGAQGTPSGDAGVDQVLAKLEATDTGAFTASYHIVRKLGPNATDATVVQDGASRSITVGDVRFLHTGEDQTCSLAARTCEAGILDARISDYSVGSAFWAGGPARALRVAMTRRSGPPVTSTQSVGGQSVECVDVPVGPGVEHYCATALGPVARWDTAAISVELTGITDVADPAAFQVGG